MAWESDGPGGRESIFTLIVSSLRSLSSTVSFSAFVDLFSRPPPLPFLSFFTTKFGILKSLSA